MAGSSWTASTRADAGPRRHNATMLDTTSAGPGKQRFDTAVPAVAHPALQMMHPRLVLDPGAIADALHPALDRHLTDRAAHLFLDSEKLREPRLHVGVAGGAADQPG